MVYFIYLFSLNSIEQYPASVPLAKKWSIENVESFLKFLGFEDEAPAFREQVFAYLIVDLFDIH